MKIWFIGVLVLILCFVIYFVIMNKNKTPCQVNRDACLEREKNERETGQILADKLPCPKCNDNGLFVESRWRHPLAKKSYCFDKFSGKRIPGTDENVREITIDCDKFPPYSI